MKKLLPVHKPFMSYRPRDNYIFSILGEDDYFYEYIFENYIQICFYYNTKWKNIVTLSYEDMYHSYAKSACLDCVFIHRNNFNLLKNDFVDSLIALIDDGYYISISINKYYIKNYAATGHYPHQMMICGYSLDEQLFYFMDFINGKYKNGQCYFNELIDAFQNYRLTNIVNYYDGILAVKKRENYNCSININSFVSQLYSLLNEKYSFNETSFGISWFDAIEYSIKNRLETFDIKDTMLRYHYLAEHINLMIKRVLYLMRDNVHSSLSQIEEGLIYLHRHINLKRNKCLKLQYTSDSLYIEDTELQEDILQSYRKIKCEYREIINHMINFF